MRPPTLTAALLVVLVTLAAAELDSDPLATLAKLVQEKKKQLTGHEANRTQRLQPEVEQKHEEGEAWRKRHGTSQGKHEQRKPFEKLDALHRVQGEVITQADQIRHSKDEPKEADQLKSNLRDLQGKYVTNSQSLSTARFQQGTSLRHHESNQLIKFKEHSQLTTGQAEEKSRKDHVAEDKSGPVKDNKPDMSTRDRRTSHQLTNNMESKRGGHQINMDHQVNSVALKQDASSRTHSYESSRKGFQKDSYMQEDSQKDSDIQQDNQTRVASGDRLRELVGRNPKSARQPSLLSRPKSSTTLSSAIKADPAESVSIAPRPSFTAFRPARKVESVESARIAGSLETPESYETAALLSTSGEPEPPMASLKHSDWTTSLVDEEVKLGTSTNRVLGSRGKGGRKSTRKLASYKGETEPQDDSKIVEVFVRPDGTAAGGLPKLRSGRNQGKELDEEELCQNCQELDDWKPMRHHATKIDPQPADKAETRKLKTELRLTGKLRENPSLAVLPNAMAEVDAGPQPEVRSKTFRQPQADKAPVRAGRLNSADHEVPDARAGLGPSFSGIVGFDGFSDAPFGNGFDGFPTFAAPSLSADTEQAPLPIKKPPKKRIPAALLRPHTYTDKYVPPDSLYVQDPLKDIEKVPGPKYVPKPYTPLEVKPLDYATPDVDNYYANPEVGNYYAPPAVENSYAAPSFSSYVPPVPNKSPPYRYHIPNFRPPIEAKPVEPAKPAIIHVAGQSAAPAIAQPHATSHRPYSSSFGSTPRVSADLEYSRPPVVSSGAGSSHQYPAISSFLTPDLAGEPEPGNHLESGKYSERQDSVKDDLPASSFNSAEESADFSSSFSFPFLGSHGRQSPKDSGGNDKAFHIPIGSFGDFNGFPDFSADFGPLTSESTVQERTQFSRPKDHERTQVFHPDGSAHRRGGARRLDLLVEESGSPLRVEDLEMEVETDGYGSYRWFTDHPVSLVASPY